MKKNLYFIILITLSLVFSGCNQNDMFGAGTSELLIKQPYANENGYILVSYDLKEVSSRENDILNEYDFSGPMHDVLSENSSSSTVIEQTTPEVTPGATPGLPINATTGYVVPVMPSQGIITSFYGARWGSKHNGIDIGCPHGSNIYAITDGVVIDAGYNASMGNFVRIAHSNDKNGIVSSIYMHNSSLLVKNGDTVVKGQVIAKAGSTGNSTGPHCHLGLTDTSGNYVDPYHYLNLSEYPISDSAENRPDGL